MQAVTGKRKALCNSRILRGVVSSALLLGVHVGLSGEIPVSKLRAAISAIDTQEILRHITTLSSDDFEGRLPGTRGEDLTVAYVVKQFKALGLESGTTDGSYVQAVPMSAFVTRSKSQFTVGSRVLPLNERDDIVVFSTERQSTIDLNSELVFVGYGVIAPEYGWDDYKGADLRGKTLVMLINDPQIPDPVDPSKLDDKMFGGKAMTYYGRWTYKYEMAARLGAAAAIIVHETGPAGYPYSVVKNSFERGNFDLQSAQSSTEHPVVASWIPLETAQTLFTACGMNFETMKEAALSKTFTPISLGASVQFHVENSWRDFSSRNAVASVRGSDPKRKEQVVIYSAHWDHFGWDPKLPGSKHEQIYHGAADNASGVAALLELARAFKTLRQPPARSVLFIATTGEEEGHLGARYYAEHPLYPLRDTLADVNMDVMATWGKTSDIELFGSGKSSLDDTVRAAAGQMGLVVSDDSHPERGLFFRADNLEFARAGVPVVYLGAGRDVTGKPPGFAGQRMDAWIARDYHQVTDTVKADWDLAGTAQETELLFRVGLAVAEARDRPHWNEKSEFKAMRDSTSH